MSIKGKKDFKQLNYGWKHLQLVCSRDGQLLLIQVKLKLELLSQKQLWFRWTLQVCLPLVNNENAWEYPKNNKWLFIIIIIYVSLSLLSIEIKTRTHVNTLGSYNLEIFSLKRKIYYLYRWSKSASFSVWNIKEENVLDSWVKREIWIISDKARTLSDDRKINIEIRGKRRIKMIFYSLKLGGINW